MPLRLNKKLVLASQSPRRAELLKKIGLSFDVRVIEVDESIPPHIPVDEVAEHIAAIKMRAQKPHLQKNELIITADSVVSLDGKAYGKPADEQEAFDMISELADKQHQVYTGVCMMDESKYISFTDKTEVLIDAMSDEEIWYYIRTSMPMDKAGAYGIQDWIGFAKIGLIKGSYANVMGLPVHRVFELLKDWDAPEYA